MLKVTYEQLRDPSFSRGMGKLANFPGFKSPAVAYNVAKINLRLTEESELADKLFQKLVKPYAHLDDKGEFVPNRGIPNTFSIKDECVEEWKGKLDEFHAVTVEIDRPRVNLADCEGAGLTPLEMGALENVLHSLEAVST